MSRGCPRFLRTLTSVTTTATLVFSFIEQGLVEGQQQCIQWNPLLSGRFTCFLATALVWMLSKALISPVSLCSACAQGKASRLTPALPVCTSWPCGFYRHAYYCLGNVEILCPFGILLNLRNKDIGLWGINSYSRGTGEGAYFNHRLSSEPSFMPHSLSNSTSWEQEHEVLSKKRTYLIFLPQRFGALLSIANSV